MRPNTVIDWRRRFEREGVPGLADRPRPGKPQRYGADFRKQVLAVVVVATGLSETDGFQHRAHWIIAGAFVLLVAYFLFIPGWGAA